MGSQLNLSELISAFISDLGFFYLGKEIWTIDWTIQPPAMKNQYLILLQIENSITFRPKPARVFEGP